MDVFNTIISRASSNKLSNVGSGSPNLLLYSLNGGGGTPPPPPPPPPPSCSGQTFSGSLTGTGDVEYQPNGAYYFANSGTHSGNLEGPAGTDFDLYLYKWNSFWGWLRVASSTSSSSSESINYNGSSGYYIWEVRSYSGSGGYDLCLDAPGITFAAFSETDDAKPEGLPPVDDVTSLKK